MLTRLGLRNFKAFGDEMQYADLAPITLIYGPNSGGKSSVIQALILLKQSHGARSSENTAPFELVPQTEDADGVDLGSYQSLFHKQAVPNNYTEGMEMEIEITTDTRPNEKFSVHSASSSIRFVFQDDSAYVGRNRRSRRSTRTAKGVLARVEYSRSQSGEVGYTANEVKYHGPQPGGYRESERDGETYHIAEIKRDYRLVLTRRMRRGRTEYFLDQQGLEEYLEFIKGMKPRKFVEFLRSARSVRAIDTDEAVIARGTAGRRHRRNNLNNTETSYMNGLPIMLSFSEERPTGTRRRINRDMPIRFEPDDYLESAGKLSYIGPLRQQPARTYPLAGRPSGNRSEDEVGKSGQHTPYLLHNNREGVTEINNLLKKEKLDIPYKVSTDTHPGPQGTTSISLALEDDSGTVVGLPDVGFGVNQVLPVIVQGVVARDKIICVEQPEIHLHPRLQAKFADFLIETSSADKANKDNGVGNQWIVETHSEMVIRRLQRRIREGVISPEDVSVLYVDPQDDGSSTIQRLELDADGEFLDEWPDGFFDEDYKEIMGY